jgi:peptidoglycan/LPS O-acetylase OafA/YrhL
MLGLFRYVLALMVVFSHLYPEILWWQGTYAVTCFYVISGYLMSKILNEVYVGKSWFLRYVINRCLRIFPAYLLTLLLTLSAIAIYPQVANVQLNAHMRLGDVMYVPTGFWAWAENLSLLYIGGGELTVSQSWSLRVEIVFYFAMAFLVRSPLLVLVWCFLSACYLIYLEVSSATFMARYMSVFGASYAFSIGALVHQLAKMVKLSRLHLFLAPVLLSVYLWQAPSLWGFPQEHMGWQAFFSAETYGLYGFTFLGAYLLLAIVACEKPPSVGSFGIALGNLAYPIFLTHWLVVILALGVGLSSENKFVFLVSTLVGIHLVSIAIYYLVERPVNEKLRSQIRGQIAY